MTAKRASSSALGRTLRATVLRTEQASSGVALLLALVALQGCAGSAADAGFSLKLERARSTPARALVTIDEQYIGTLDYVAARGVRLPEGEHRLSVEHEGYFPYDTIIRSDGTTPVRLVIELTPVPD